MTLSIIQGSILDFDGDAIVNPANSFLRHGGGLARVIEDAAHTLPGASRRGILLDHPDRKALTARRQAWGRDHAEAPLIATGNAYATSAGLLPYKAVIHAVGPIWNGGRYQERVLLVRAHDSALRIAEDRGYRSIAFPALSCGIFGFPLDEAAMLAVATLRMTNLSVSVYLFDQATYDAYRAAADWAGINA